MTHSLRTLFIIFLIVFIILLFVLENSSLLLKHPPIWPDEALFADVAISFSDKGKMASNLLGQSIPGLSEHAFWTPPLYFSFLSSWINLFGQTIESLRLSSIFIAAGSLIIMFLIGKVLFKKTLPALLGTLFLLLDPGFSQSSRIARMDILVFFLSLAALYLTAAAVVRKRPFLYPISGFFTGLALITHPLGAIGLFTICSVLLFSPASFKERISSLTGVLLPSLMVVFIWLLSIRRSWDIFLIQNQLQFARKATETSYISQIFTTDPSWTLLLLINALIFFIMLIITFKSPTFINRLVIIGIFISSVSLIWSKEMWYLIYFQPFIALGTITIILNFLRNNEIIKKIVLSTLVVLLLILMNNYMTRLRIVDSNIDYHDFTQRLSNQLPERGTVFLAVIPDPYFDLRAGNDLQFREFSPVPIQNKAYRELLNGADYLILNMIPNKIIQDYVKKNASSSSIINQPNGYSATVVHLVDKVKRN
ncbi:phospholipid carrier-dependent glycosyltransferase [candidate division WS5 bacterium]|uniref:Phospholipid carrier-dependent glycosyltransferase n=1 Tax=candidate division WS5 bacterium TaxID=2093353 RepID=A0A419DGZ1_9BACT|nr:MAG: phospholipid carrier-dependent glycosyltransferase [candidate division WS5 bacterium]